MGRYQNSYLIGLEDDAWSMDREEWIEKHGISHVDIYDKIEKEKNSEFDFVANELYSILFMALPPG